jgi:arylsulfatase A-like enzyme
MLVAGEAPAALYTPLLPVLEMVDGPLHGPGSGERRRVFQSVVRAKGLLRTSKRIADDGWFVLQPDGTSIPHAGSAATAGALDLAPGLQGRSLFINADFSTRMVDLVAIGVESLGSGRIAFTWDNRSGRPLGFDGRYGFDLVGAEGVREYLVPVRRLPGWTGRVRAFGLRVERLDGEATVHHLRFITAGFVEALRREPGPDGVFRGRLELGDESRAILFAPAGSVLQARLKLPREADLDLGFAMHPSPRPTDGTAVSFRVEVSVPGEAPKVILADRIDPEGEGTGQWHDRRIPLDDLGGREVTLRFITEAEPAPPAEGRGRPPERFGDHAVWSAPTVTVRNGRRDPARRNVIVVLADTLRPDHLSCYGSPRRTSPHLDRLASRGLLHSMVRSQAPWTAPSTGSLFTSLYPSRHGAERDGERLRPACLTLAEVLADARFQTKGFISNIVVSALLNFDQGFDSYTYIRPSRGTPYAASPVLFPHVFAWLEANADKPFFLYVHTMDPHSPFIVPHPFDRLFDIGGLDADAFDRAVRPLRRRKLGNLTADDLPLIHSLYDGEIALGDHYLGRLMAELRRLGLEQSTTVIYTSDHGQEYLEHGHWGHSKTLYGETVDVPLVIRPGSRVTERLPEGGLRPGVPARLVDLYPTVLEALGVDIPPSAAGELTGRSLLTPPPARHQDPPLLFSEGNKGKHLLFAVQQGRFKFIRRLAPVAGDELYDLETDPGEQVNLIDSHRKLAARLADWGESVWKKREATRDTVGFDGETRERLRALGYVED